MLSISRWRMPSRIGQRNAHAVVAGKVVVCHDMRATKSLGLVDTGRGRSKIHVLRRTTWTDRHGEVRVKAEVGGGGGEDKAKGQARRGVQQGKVDHRVCYDPNRVVPLPLSLPRPDSPSSQRALIFVPIPSSTRALFL
jgi:hypothetical protein